MPMLVFSVIPQAVHISRAGYEPSQLDILYAEGITSSNGLTYTDFVFPQSTASTSGFDCDDNLEPLIKYVVFPRIELLICSHGF